jgi:hypothetical protein
MKSGRSARTAGHFLQVLLIVDDHVSDVLNVLSGPGLTLLKNCCTA